MRNTQEVEYTIKDGVFNFRTSPDDSNQSLVIQFDHPIQEQSQDLMDDLIQNHGLLAEKRYVDRDRKRQPKNASQLRINQWDQVRPSKNRKSMPHHGSRYTRHKSNLDNPFKSSRKSVSPTKHIKIMFNQVSLDSPFKRYVLEEPDSSERSSDDNDGNVSGFRNSRKPSRERSSQSRATSPYDGMSKFQSFMIGKERASKDKKSYPTSYDTSPQYQYPDERKSKSRSRSGNARKTGSKFLNLPETMAAGRVSAFMQSIDPRTLKKLSPRLSYLPQQFQVQKPLISHHPSIQEVSSTSQSRRQTNNFEPGSLKGYSNLGNADQGNDGFQIQWPSRNAPEQPRHMSNQYGSFGSNNLYKQPTAVWPSIDNTNQYQTPMEMDDTHRTIEIDFPGMDSRRSQHQMRGPSQQTFYPSVQSGRFQSQRNSAYPQYVKPPSPINDRYLNKNLVPTLIRNSQIYGDSRNQGMQYPNSFDVANFAPPRPFAQKLQYENPQMLQNPLYQNFIKNMESKSITPRGYQSMYPQPLPNLYADPLDKFAALATLYANKVEIHQSVAIMRQCNQIAKKRKTQILNNYIIYSAIKIQKVWRGHFARKVIIPINQAFTPEKEELLKAVVLGWKTRRIWKLKDMKDKMEMITEHDKLNDEETMKKSVFDEKRFKESRRNAVKALLSLFKNLAHRGQWVLRIKDVDLKQATPGKRGSNQLMPRQSRSPDKNNNDSFHKRMSYDPRAAAKVRHSNINAASPYAQNLLNSQQINMFNDKPEPSEARMSLAKRQSFIPDIKKRNQAKAPESPEDFLGNYMQRKKIRNDMLDPVEANSQLTIDPANLSRHLNRDSDDYRQLQQLEDPFDGDSGEKNKRSSRVQNMMSNLPGNKFRTSLHQPSIEEEPEWPDEEGSGESGRNTAGKKPRSSRRPRSGQQKDLIELEKGEKVFAQVECNKYGKPLDPNFNSRDRLTDLFQEDEDGGLVLYDKQNPLPGKIFGLLDVDGNGNIQGDQLRPPKSKKDIKLLKVDKDDKILAVATMQEIIEETEDDQSEPEIVDGPPSKRSAKPSTADMRKSRMPKKLKEDERVFAKVECNKFGRVVDPNFSRNDKIHELFQEDEDGKLVPFNKSEPLPGPVFGLAEVDDAGNVEDDSLSKPKSQNEVKLIKVDGDDKITDLSMPKPRQSRIPDDLKSGEKVFAKVECSEDGKIIDPNFKGKEPLKTLYQEDDQGKLVEFDQENPMAGPIFGLAEVDDLGNIDDKAVGKPKKPEKVNLIKVDKRNKITELPQIEEVSELSSQSEGHRYSSRQTKAAPRQSRMPKTLKPDEKVYAKVECNPNGKVVDPNFSQRDKIAELFQEDEDGKLVPFNKSEPLPGPVFGLAEVDAKGRVDDDAISKPKSQNEVKLIKVDGDDKITDLSMPKPRQSRIPDDLKSGEKVFAKVECSEDGKIIDPNFKGKEPMKTLYQEDDQGKLVEYDQENPMAGPIFGLAEVDSLGNVQDKGVGKPKKPEEVNLIKVDKRNKITELPKIEEVSELSSQSNTNRPSSRQQTKAAPRQSRMPKTLKPDEKVYAKVECNPNGKVVDPNFSSRDKIAELFQEDEDGKLVPFNKSEPLPGPVFGLAEVDAKGRVDDDAISKPKSQNEVKLIKVGGDDKITDLSVPRPRQSRIPDDLKSGEKVFAKVECTPNGRVIDPNFKGKELMPTLYQEDDQGKLVKFDQENPMAGPIFGLAEVDDLGNIDDKAVGKPKKKNEVNLIKVDKRNQITELPQIDELSELSSQSDTHRPSSRQQTKAAPRQSRMPKTLKPDEKVYAKVECYPNGKVVDPNFSQRDKIAELFQEDEDGKLVPFNKSEPLPGPVFGLAEVDDKGRVDDDAISKPKSQNEVKLIKVDGDDKITDLSVPKARQSRIPDDLKSGEKVFAKVECTPNGRVIDPNFQCNQVIPKIYQEDEDGNLVEFDKENPLAGPTFGLAEVDSVGNVDDKVVGKPKENNEVNLIKVDKQNQIKELPKIEELSEESEYDSAQGSSRKKPVAPRVSRMPKKLKPHERVFAKVECNQNGKVVDPNFSTRDKIEELFQEDDEGTMVPYDKAKPLPGPIFGLAEVDKDGNVEDEVVGKPKSQNEVTLIKVDAKDKIKELKPDGPRPSRIPDNLRSDEKVYAKVECTKNGRVIDPNFQGNEIIPKLYQEDDRGKLVEFDKEQPLAGPVFGLAEVDNLGNVQDKAVGEPKKPSDVTLIKIDGRNRIKELPKIPEATEESESEYAPSARSKMMSARKSFMPKNLKPREQVFAKVECNPNGKVVDPNFSTRDKIAELFQEDDEGTLVPFDKAKPLSGPIFGLAEVDEDGNVDDDKLSKPKSQNEVTLIKVDAKDKITDLSVPKPRESRMPDDLKSGEKVFAKVECTPTGRVIDPNFKGTDFLPKLYQEDESGKLVEFDKEKPLQGPVFGLAEVDSVGNVQDKTVGKPKKPEEVTLIKIDNKKQIQELPKIEELAKVPASEFGRPSQRQSIAPRMSRVPKNLKPRDRVFAKVECNENGKVVDPNFSSKDKIENLFQEDEEGTLVPFDKENVLPGPVFGLAEVDEDGNVDDMKLSNPKSQNDVTLIKVDAEDKIKELKPEEPRPSRIPDNLRSDEKVYAKVACTKNGRVIDPNFQGNEILPQLYQEDDRGNLVEFDKEQPLAGPVFGLAEVDNLGNVNDQAVGEPKKPEEVTLIKVDGRNKIKELPKIEEVNEKSESEYGPTTQRSQALSTRKSRMPKKLKPREKVFAKVECNRNGKVVDPNFSSKDKIEKLFQEDDKGTLVLYDKAKPLPGPIFGLAEVDEDGNVDDDNLSKPKSQNEVTLIKVDANDQIQELKPEQPEGTRQSRIPDDLKAGEKVFAKVECSKNGIIVDPNFQADKKITDLYQEDGNGNLVDFDKSNPLPGPVFGLAEVGITGKVEDKQIQQKSDKPAELVKVNPSRNKIEHLAIIPEEEEESVSHSNRQPTNRSTLKQPRVSKFSSVFKPDEKRFAKIKCNEKGQVIDPNFSTSDKVANMYQEDGKGNLVPFNKEKPLPGQIFGLAEVADDGEILDNDISQPKQQHQVNFVTVDHDDKIKNIVAPRESKLPETLKAGEKVYAKVECNNKGRVIDPNFNSLSNKQEDLFQEDSKGNLVEFNPAQPIAGPVFALAEVDEMGFVVDDKVGAPKSEEAVKLIKLDKNDKIKEVVPIASQGSKIPTDLKPDEEVFALVECNQRGRVIDRNFSISDKMDKLYQEDDEGKVVPFDKARPLPGPVFALAKVDSKGKVADRNLSTPKKEEAVKLVKLDGQNILHSLEPIGEVSDSESEAETYRSERPKKTKKSRIPKGLKPDDKVFAEVECNKFGRVIDPNFTATEKLTDLYQKDKDGFMVEFDKANPLPGKIFALANVDEKGIVADEVCQPKSEKEVKLLKVEPDNRVSELPLPGSGARASKIPTNLKPNEEVFAIVECNKFGRVVDPNFQAKEKIAELFQEDEDGKLVEYKRSNPLPGKVFALAKVDATGNVADENCKPKSENEVKLVKVDADKKVSELPSVMPRQSKIPTDLKPNEKVFAMVECNKFGKVLDPNFSSGDRVTEMFQVDENGKKVELDKRNPLPGPIFGLAEVDSIGQIKEGGDVGKPISEKDVKLVKVDDKNNLSELPPLLEIPESDSEEEDTTSYRSKRSTFKPRQSKIPATLKPDEKVFAKVECDRAGNVIDDNFQEVDNISELFQEDESGNLVEFNPEQPIAGPVFALAEVDKKGRVNDPKLGKPKLENEVNLVKVDGKNKIRDLSPIDETTAPAALNKLSTRLSTMPRQSRIPRGLKPKERVFAKVECDKEGKVLDKNFAPEKPLQNLFQEAKDGSLVEFDKANPLPGKIFALADVDEMGDVVDDDLSKPKFPSKVNLVKLDENDKIKDLTPPRASVLPANLKPSDRVFAKVACDKNGNITDKNFGDGKVSSLFQQNDKGELVNFDKRNPLPSEVFALAEVDENGQVDDSEISQPKSENKVKLIKVDEEDKITPLKVEKPRQSRVPKDLKPDEKVFAQIECDKNGNVVDPNFSKKDKIHELFQEDEDGNLVEFDKANPLPGPVFGLAEVDKEGKVEDDTLSQPKSQNQVKLVKVNGDDKISALPIIAEASDEDSVKSAIHQRKPSRMTLNLKPDEKVFAQIECSPTGRILDSNFRQTEKIKDLFQKDETGKLVKFDKRNPQAGPVFGLAEVNDEGEVEKDEILSSRARPEDLKYVKVGKDKKIEELPSNMHSNDSNYSFEMQPQPLTLKERMPENLKPQEKVYAKIQCNEEGEIIDPNFQGEGELPQLFQETPDGKLVEFDPEDPLPGEIFGLAEVSPDGQIGEVGAPRSEADVKLLKVDKYDNVENLPDAQPQRPKSKKKRAKKTPQPYQVKPGEEVLAKIECNKFGRVVDPNFETNERIPKLFQEDEEGNIVEFDRKNPLPGKIFGLAPIDEKGDLVNKKIEPKNKENIEKILKDQSNELVPLPEMEPIEDESDGEVASNRLSEIQDDDDMDGPGSSTHGPSGNKYKREPKGKDRTGRGMQPGKADDRIMSIEPLDEKSRERPRGTHNRLTDMVREEDKEDDGSTPQDPRFSKLTKPREYSNDPNNLLNDIKIEAAQLDKDKKKNAKQLKKEEERLRKEEKKNQPLYPMTQIGMFDQPKKKKPGVSTGKKPFGKSKNKSSIDQSTQGSNRMDKTFDKTSSKKPRILPSDHPLAKSMIQSKKKPLMLDQSDDLQQPGPFNAFKSMKSSKPDQSFQNTDYLSDEGKNLLNSVNQRLQDDIIGRKLMNRMKPNQSTKNIAKKSPLKNNFITPNAKKGTKLGQTPSGSAKGKNSYQASAFDKPNNLRESRFKPPMMEQANKPKSPSVSPVRNFSYSPSGNKIYRGRDVIENKYNMIQCFIEQKFEDD